MRKRTICHCNIKVRPSRTSLSGTIAVELRTAPEVLAYLDARHGLPYTDLRIIGDERALFEFYLLNGGSLQGCAALVPGRAVGTRHHDHVQCRGETRPGASSVPFAPINNPLCSLSLDRSHQQPAAGAMLLH